MKRILPRWFFFLLSSSFPVPPNWCTFTPILFAVFMRNILLLVTVVKIGWCWTDTNAGGQERCPSGWAGLLSAGRPSDVCCCPCSTTDLGAVGSAAHPAASQSQITQLKSVGSVTYADLGEAATSRWGWQWAALAIISYPDGGTIANLGMASAAASLLCTCIICQFISHLFPYYRCFTMTSFFSSIVF